jgi:3'-phosphoadenosine 5'-phosphosulfate sulfotransferase (PAPS reductase)/FAD synthetase
MFPSRTKRFCTEELKVFPMQAHLTQLIDNGEDIVNAVGIRAEESAARCGA